MFQDGFASLHGVWRYFSSFLLLQHGVGRWGFVLSLGTVDFVVLFRFQYFGGSCFFRARLCILAQAYVCQFFMIGVCFKDVNFSSYPTWLARIHSASFAGFSAYRVFISGTVSSKHAFQQLQFLDVDACLKSAKPMC